MEGEVAVSDSAVPFPGEKVLAESTGSCAPGRCSPRLSKSVVSFDASMGVISNKEWETGERLEFACHQRSRLSVLSSRTESQAFAQTSLSACSIVGASHRQLLLPESPCSLTCIPSRRPRSFEKGSMLREARGGFPCCSRTVQQGGARSE